MDKETMGRVCKWFNMYMRIFGYEAKVEGNEIVIYDLDDTNVAPKHFDNVMDIIFSYYDLLFDNFEIGEYDDEIFKNWESDLAKLEFIFTEKAMEINTEDDNGDLAFIICGSLMRLRELRTIVEFNEYWEVA